MRGKKTAGQQVGKVDIEGGEKERKQEGSSQLLVQLLRGHRVPY